MQHTPKEEEILADWKKRGDQVSPMDRGLSWDEIADYWLRIRREAIAEERERVKKDMLKKMKDWHGTGIAMIEDYFHLTQE